MGIGLTREVERSKDEAVLYHSEEWM
jgi:hypothetical protein